MASVHQQFVNGEYSEVVKRLECQLNDTNIHQPLSTQLLLQNNVIVCNYIMDYLRLKRKDVLSNLKDLIYQCSSIPARRDILCTELTLLYNYIYIHLAHSKKKNTTQVSNTELYDCVTKVLYRVYQFLVRGDKHFKFAFDQNCRENYILLLDKCLHTLTFDKVSGDLILPLCQCSWVLCILEVKAGFFVTSYQVLQKVRDVLNSHSFSKSDLEKGFTIPLQVDQSYVHVTSSATCQDVTTYLMAVSLCRPGNRDQHLDDVNVDPQSPLRLPIDFMMSYELYLCGKYSESISLLMEMVRSGICMTQRLKARIYNMTGTCFHRLDKAQLAIQMYKEALLTDFSYLLPLYNTSVQYSSLGNTDMQLECLNLLVKAIEMREAPRSFVDSVDMLRLLDTGDDDVTYTKTMYMLANKCLLLHKYDVASEKYMELLKHLSSWEASCPDSKGLPSLLQIHQEAILSLLKTHRYKDTLTLCDTVLSCYHDNTGSNNSASELRHSNMASSQTDTTQEEVRRNKGHCEKDMFSGKKMKRKYCDMEDIEIPCATETDDENNYNRSEVPYDTEVVTLKYKAEALVAIGDHTAALSCLTRASDSINSHKRSTLEMYRRSTEVEPKCKKQKLSNEGLSKGTSATYHPLTASLELEHGLYKQIAGILDSQNQHKDALHFHRLAAQIKPETK